ncbi:MAG: single-stranded DNA-binding protein [Vallitaleaceae bacterium]|nr:single-stranded DNA-binding protein [Vallitaleaceae bacterium]
MLNRIDIMGRLTKDPELRYTQSGTSVTSFTLAVDRDYSGKDGGEKQTDFIDCIAWRHTAEFVTKYFSKGRMAVVSGRLQVRFWDDNEGKKRKVVEIVAENVYFGDSKKDTSSSGGYHSQHGNYGTSAPHTNDTSSDYGGGFTELDGEDDELPF